MSKTALITGISGQDGAYLAKLLLSKGYRVIGAMRRSASLALARLEYLGIARDVEPFHCELLELTNITRMIERTKPDEIYNLAAQSFVSASFDQPIFTVEVTGLGAVRLLEAIRLINPGARFYQASTSEMFGNASRSPQDENTPFRPRSPYGIAKLMAHNFAVNYREAYRMFCTSGILFNHESPLRGREFVTRKITDAFARIRAGRLDTLELGNLDAKRDWGFAREYVEGMWLMLQTDRPDTYVLATNRTETVRDFVSMAAKAAGYELRFEGEAEREVAIDRQSGRTLVRVNPEFYRPAEVELLIGDASKAERELGWKAKTTLEELCTAMVKEDIRRVERGVSF